MTRSPLHASTLLFFLAFSLSLSLFRPHPNRATGTCMMCSARSDHLFFFFFSESVDCLLPSFLPRLLSSFGFLRWVITREAFVKGRWKERKRSLLTPATRLDSTPAELRIMSGVEGRKQTDYFLVFLSLWLIPP